VTRAAVWRCSLLFAVAIAAAAASTAASAGAKPRDPDPPAKAEKRADPRAYPQPLPILNRDERLPEGYQDLVRKLMQRGPGDTLGDGVFAMAEGSFHAGAFEEASGRYVDFAQRFPRNLRVNLALERMLLIRDGRDFGEAPLKIYARADLMRAEGRADSAEAALTAGLAQYPGTRLRYHFRFALAEIARDKGNHAAAVEQALAVADTSASSRLAPAALELAGDETLAAGGPRERASGYYQALLERFPDSPLAPAVREHLLQLRKKMQL
jgi:TolA-binding protein